MGSSTIKVLPSSLRVQRHKWGLLGRLGDFLGVMVVLASGLLGWLPARSFLVLEGGFAQVGLGLA